MLRCFASFSTLYFLSVLVSSANNPILIAIFRQDASPADSVPNGITAQKTNQDGSKTTTKSEKIDTNGLLKKEDKNDI
jgi:hypothetical protein